MVDLAAILTGPDLGSHQLRERVSERIAELLADGQVRPGSSCGVAEKAETVAPPRVRHAPAPWRKANRKALEGRD